MIARATHLVLLLAGVRPSRSANHCANWRPNRNGELELIAGSNLRKREKFAPPLLLSENSSTCEVLPIAAVMFKIGRCGSTLLTNMIDASSPWIRIVEEPPHLLELFATEGNLPSPEAIRKAFSLHAHKAAGDQTSVFFNLQSQMWPYLQHVRAALGPDVPLIYLYREPYQVAMSLMEAPPGFLHEYPGSSPIDRAVSYINESLSHLLKLDMVVYDFADVQSLELPRWVLWSASKAAGGRRVDLLSQDLQHAEPLWLEVMQHDAKQQNIIRTVEINNGLAKYHSLPTPAKEMVAQLMYSEAPVKFRLRHPYLDRRLESATPVRQLNTLSTDQNQPYSVPSYIGTTTLGNWSAALSQEVVPMLTALGEPNVFAWKPAKGNCSVIIGRKLYETTTIDEPHTFAQWTEGEFTDWQAHPNRYLQMHIPFFNRSADGPLSASTLAALTSRIIPAPAQAATCKSFGSEPCPGYSLLISHPGAISPLHWDAKPTLLMQTLGEKTVYLLPPNTFPSYPNGHCLARRSIWNLHSFHPIYQANVDLQRGFVKTLRPGDLLYMPPLWGHYIISRSTSVTVVGRLLAAPARGADEQAMMDTFNQPPETILQQILIAESDPRWGIVHRAGEQDVTGDTHGRRTPTQGRTLKELWHSKPRRDLVSSRGGDGCVMHDDDSSISDDCQLKFGKDSSYSRDDYQDQLTNDDSSVWSSPAYRRSKKAKGARSRKAKSGRTRMEE